MRSRALLASACALLLGSAAQADVRLSPASSAAPLQLKVVTTASGVWTPVGRTDSLSLNVLGDRVGDGRPAHALRADAVLVAWSRPVASELRLAVGRREWLREWGVVVADPTVAPIVVSTTRGWIVAWHEGVPSTLRALEVTPAGEQSAIDMDASGLLVAGVSTGRAVHLLAFAADGSLSQIVALNPTDSNPIIFRAPRTITALALFSTTPGDNLPPIIFRSPRTITALALSSTTTLADALAVARPELKLVSTRDGGVQVAAFWWESPQELSYVALDEDGPTTSPATIRTPGRSSYSPSLVQQALRDLASR